jgi:hypothetical protein
MAFVIACMFVSHTRWQDLQSLTSCDSTSIAKSTITVFYRDCVEHKQITSLTQSQRDRDALPHLPEPASTAILDAKSAPGPLLLLLLLPAAAEGVARTRSLSDSRLASRQPSSATPSSWALRTR